MLLIILPLSSILADFDYKFELFSFDPIYKEYLADRSKPELSLEVLYYAEGFPDRILQDDMEWGFNDYDLYYIEEFPLSEPFAGAPLMIRAKLGESISILRNTFTFDHWLSPIFL